MPELVTAREKRYFYYIRKYASSVKANIEEQQELISLANQVPFDDRSNTQAKVENISMVRIKDHLLKVKSRLAEQVGKIPDQELLGYMELISGPNEYIFPRNVALMLFAEQPHKFFPYTQVDIVEFPEGDAGPYTELEPIKGPVPLQISRTLDILKDKLVKGKVIKPADRAESIRIASYPFQAIEEIVVNAFYHRDYQQREPIEIRIYPDSLVIINHGGPDRSIKLEAFNSGQVRSRRYRNRRLGEFLKELELTEGRATGISTILKALNDNGSPVPRFHTDNDRTFFEVELFIHPAFTSKQPILLDVNTVVWDLNGIDKLMNQLIALAADEGVVRDIAGDIVGDIASFIERIEYQVNEIISTVVDDVVSDIAGGIAGGIDMQKIGLLKLCTKPVLRNGMFQFLNMAQHPTNFKLYIKPLLDLNWLTMTIPHKPTSPNQKYLSTLKGRLILEFLKHKTK